MYTYAIGDIHGKLAMLVNLMGKINADANGEDYKLVFVGDYIDRGENSRGVLDFIIDLKKHRAERGLETITLMGNHEDMAVNDEFKDSWLMNGGYQTLLSYPDSKLSDEHIAFMKALDLYHETEKNSFVHAAAAPNIPMNEQSRTMLMWSRYRYEQQSGLPKVLVHGHTPCKHVEQTHDRVNLDTGAVFGVHGYGTLTAAKIDPSTGQPVSFIQEKEHAIDRIRQVDLKDDF